MPRPHSLWALGALMSVTWLAASLVSAVEYTAICGDPGTAVTIDPQAGGFERCTGALKTCDNPGFTQDILYAEYGTHPGKTVNITTFSNIGFAYGRVQAPVAMLFGKKSEIVYANQTQKNITVPTGKVQYWIETDKFSLLELNGTFTPYSDPYAAKEDFYIKLEFAGKSTNAIRRVGITGVGEDFGVYIVPFWSAVITLDRGNVTAIRWDNTCSGCQYMCVDGACSVPYRHCVDHTNNISCDIKVYIAWEGSDVDNDYMLSGQQTMKNFRAFSARFAYDVAARTYGKVQDRIPSHIPVPPNVPFT